MRASEIISGEARGVIASLIRGLLLAPSWGYGLIMGARNRLYDGGVLPSARLPAPVICVGNLTTGGTGKTPMAIWLCRYLAEGGKKVVLLSRGYRGGDDSGNEEVRMFREALPDVPVVVEADRVRGGREALEDYQPDVLVLDDGFQHRRLKRDLDVVMIDSLRPFGNGRVLPGGCLREPMTGLKRAGAVVLSRSDLLGENELEGLKQRIRSLMEREREDAPVIACCRHEPIGIFDMTDQRAAPGEARGKTLFAFCGIGHPGAFVKTLEKMGAKIAGRRFYRDHVAYGEGVLAGLAEAYRRSGAEWLMTTEKDWVKLKSPDVRRRLPELRWLKIDLVVGEGREALCGAINQALRMDKDSRVTHSQESR